MPTLRVFRCAFRRRIKFATGRTCRMGILVELASCQFHAYCGAGRMPTLLEFSGQDAHSTAIDANIVGRAGCPLYWNSAGRMPTLLRLMPILSGGQDAHSTAIHSKTEATPHL
ncbi:MAG: hypothetical protein F6K63_23790 [Moorea sp. SIO1G6]|uniref:hypothetical protein n=1 Tax=Moorena sp. SIO1G6 TaxID=2607840 RepID=UPI0013BF3860|nr:hypothetical protein [Moorena sp. SIO1G6]NET67244.1 hypothetical protein [Moorena sp. SIO1G6]